MGYEVLLAPAAERDFKRLPPDLRNRIRSAMEALADSPRRKVEKLAGLDSYRVRVGDYRIVFRVDDAAREVLVARVRHRREVYKR